MQLLLNGGGRLLWKIFIFSIEAVGQFAYPERPATKDNWLCIVNPEHMPSKNSSIFSRLILRLIPRTKGPQKKAT